MRYNKICQYVLLFCMASSGACLALECPPVPDQAHREWDVTIKTAVVKLGPAKGAELENRTRTTTADVMSKLPQADRVYLEQMMYATYCSAIRDDKKLSESDKASRLHSYNQELRRTLFGVKPPAPKPDWKQQKKGKSDIHGTWLTDVIHDRYASDASYRLRFEFAQQDGTLHGTVCEMRPDDPVTATGRKIRISDGKVGAGKVSFSTQGEVLDGSGRISYKTYYQGDVGAGIIRFARWDDLANGGREEHFEARSSQ